MAFETIAQADRYSTDQVYRGLVEEIIKVSPMLQLMPFDSVLGNSLKYVRELALPAASTIFRAPGATWTEGVHTETQVNVSLAILGGDADLDQFLKATRSNLNDIEGIILAEKAKALIHAFEDELVYGPTANGFTGWHGLIGSGPQQINAGSVATPGAGSLSLLDQLIDLVKPAPACLIMTRRSRRQINKLARTTGTFITTQRREDFGQFIQFYNDIPIFVSDFLTDTETIASGRFSAKTGGTGSSIFALNFGPAQYHGIQSPEGIQVEDLGILELKDSMRRRVKWYCAHALKSTLSLARLDGLSTADWIN